MAKIEKLENNKVKLSFEVTPAEFADALVKAYQKTGRRYSVPGFRKGKLAPKKMIESFYGPNVFFEDAFESLYNQLVPAAMTEANAFPSQPLLDLEKIDVDEGLSFSATFDLNPELTLGEYKGIELKKTDYTVHKKDVEAEAEKRINAQREGQSRLVSVERPAQMGDTVEIDYSGSVNGVKFEGGTAEHQSLELGSGHFIPGFEEQVVDMKIGEEKDINVTFPEKYHSEDLAGKDAVFTVKLHGIRVKELPALDDDFAADVSEFSTLEEYQKNIRKQVEKEMKATAEQRKTNDAIIKAIQASTAHVPQAMIREQAEGMAMDSIARMGVSNMSFDDFCKMVGAEPEQMLEPFMEQAEMRIKSEMLLGKIAEAEKIELSDEEFEAEAKKIVDEYSTDTTTEDDKAKMLDNLVKVNRDMLMYQLRLEKAQKIIVDTMVIK